MNIPSKNEVERIRRQYPAGTRICCDHMPDDPRPVPSGTMGTVIGVDDICSIMMKWDNGQGLSLVPGVDSFHTVSQEENISEVPDMGMQL
ncbi:DUF4314 domain-containing protein [Ruminococcus sp.]|jgi:hypothetical protein|uniref:DUF4314 domain-containing protein n=1 Tax=Ruminococcus sp. TaxID=41978 RepID=UPI0025F3E4A7|nr:DUF4314 domain-containing protein [Ruminococcus sp.]